MRQYEISPRSSRYNEEALVEAIGAFDDAFYRH
jgi:hypothetical protein